MNDLVIDSSIVLAVLKNEKSDEDLYSVIDGAVMSTVNVAEVYSKLAEIGIASTAAVDALLHTLDRVEPFSIAQAHQTGLLRNRTSHVGLSLGDRACLTLALELNAEVFTTDRQWTKVDVGIQVHLVR